MVQEARRPMLYAADAKRFRYKSAKSSFGERRGRSRINKLLTCVRLESAALRNASYARMNPAEPNGEGLRQLAELTSAFGLSALIGLEREIRQKSAGLRTYSLVGLASALFLLVSKYGFTDVLSPGRVALDPSRVAAQIVTGIGFLGGGVIFVRSDIVKGLTTAATIWLTAAIGMACGAGLILLAVETTIAYFIVALLFPFILRLVRGRARPDDDVLAPGVPPEDPGLPTSP